MAINPGYGIVMVGSQGHGIDTGKSSSTGIYAISVICRHYHGLTDARICGHFNFNRSEAEILHASVTDGGHPAPLIARILGQICHR